MFRLWYTKWHLYIRNCTLCNFANYHSIERYIEFDSNWLSIWNIWTNNERVSACKGVVLLQHFRLVSYWTTQTRWLILFMETVATIFKRSFRATRKMNARNRRGLGRRHGPRTKIRRTWWNIMRETRGPKHKARNPRMNVYVAGGRIFNDVQVEISKDEIPSRGQFPRPMVVPRILIIASSTVLESSLPPPSSSRGEKAFPSRLSWISRDPFLVYTTAFK